MSDKALPPITQLLAAMRRGEPGARDALFDATVTELRGLARRELFEQRSRAAQALSATALVNEATLRMLGGPLDDAEGRRHFFFLFGRAMRDVLISEIRRAATLARGGGTQVSTLVEIQAPDNTLRADLLDLDEALNDLERVDPEVAQVVVLRTLAGRTLDEAAQFLDRPVRSVRGDWEYGKAWLRTRLSERESERTPRSIA